jgi:hypothetical protein
MNEEDKIIKKKYILNNVRKSFVVFTALVVLRKEIWVVATCGYVILHDVWNTGTVFILRVASSQP